MTAPHLDDEDLSGYLDGEPARPHLASCTVCSDRLQALGEARDAVAAAGVEPLPRSAIDEMVARAVSAADTPGSQAGAAEERLAPPAAEPVDLAVRRGRRSPPPTWLITAAAAIAALAGVAGLIRATDTGDGSASLADGAVGGGVQSSESAEEGLAASPSGPPAVAGAAADPELVQVDLGDQHDPAALTALLSGGQGSFSPGQNQTASPARADGSAKAADEDGPPPPSPTTTAARGDRARCRAEAERIGAGRLARLLSTWTVRWQATPAEVLVFGLTEPSGGVSRQAMVLARSDCALLADPRF